MDDDIIENPQTGFLPCTSGMAGIYPCNGYDFLGRISLAELSAVSANDIWGWTDTTTGKEYALVGLNNGTAFVDITDTEELIYLGKLPSATGTSIWRDIKVYQDHAFIVSEASGHGMQVFDLTKLRNVVNAPETFEADTRYTGFGNAHNIVINEVSGYAYAVGTNTFNGGANFIDIQDPKNPTAAGGYGANAIEFKGFPENFKSSKNSKKNSYTLLFNINDNIEAYQVTITVFNNLTTYIQINSSYRSYIRYIGKISELPKDDLNLQGP